MLTERLGNSLQWPCGSQRSSICSSDLKVRWFDWTFWEERLDILRTTRFYWPDVNNLSSSGFRSKSDICFMKWSSIKYKNSSKMFSILYATLRKSVIQKCIKYHKCALILCKINWRIFLILQSHVLFYLIMCLLKWVNVHKCLDVVFLNQTLHYLDTAAVILYLSLYIFRSAHNVPVRPNWRNMLST